MRFQTFAPPPTYVDSANAVDSSIRHCLDSKFLGVDTETLGLLKDDTGKDYYNMTDQVVVMGLCPDDDTRYFVPRKYLHYYKPVLESSIPKALTNVKFDVHRIMNSCGVRLAGPWADTVHLDFMLDEDTRENRHGLKDCMSDYFNLPMAEYKELFGKLDPRTIVPGHELWDKYLDYASLDPWASRKLAQLLLDKLHKIQVWPEDPESDNTLCDMYWETEEAQIQTLFSMERRGIKVDVEMLKAISAKLEIQMDRLAIEINKAVGYPINPNSAPQMGDYFFNKRGYTPKSYTDKTKVPQVNEALFKELAFGKAQDPVAKLVMEYKKAGKAKSTYADGLLYWVYKDGRIHTSYSTTKTTGRLGSSEPNLQNVTRPDDDPNKIRSAFIPEAGNVMIVGDYSQLEMRILAEASADPTMIQAINDGQDMHSFTASKVLGKSYTDFVASVKAKESWAKNARTAFKKTGFGIVYGITKVTLSEQLSEELKRYVSQDEAQSYINQYLDTFPGVRGYMAYYKSMARTKGYVQTICGRYRRLSKAKYGRRAEKGHAERQAINAPIQGSAADIVKRALIYIDSDDYLKNLGWVLLHQVHDELILEGPKETADEAREIVKEYMENPFRTPLSVPLTADPGIVNNWSEK